jgi:hypothetical protein
MAHAICFAARLHLYAANAHRRPSLKTCLCTITQTKTTLHLQTVALHHSLFYAVAYKRRLRMRSYFVQRMKMGNAPRFTVGGRYSLVAGAL